MINMAKAAFKETNKWSCELKCCLCKKKLLRYEHVLYVAHTLYTFEIVRQKKLPHEMFSEIFEYLPNPWQYTNTGRILLYKSDVY